MNCCYTKILFFLLPEPWLNPTQAHLSPIWRFVKQSWNFYFLNINDIYRSKWQLTPALISCVLLKGNISRKLQSIGAKKDIWENQRIRNMSAPFAVKKLVTIYDLQKHINYGPHSGKEYPCDQCNNKFPWKENLKIHLEKVHEKKTLWLYNMWCQIVFSYKS